MNSSRWKYAAQTASYMPGAISFSAAGLVFCLLAFALTAGRGFDFTDDANALVWAAMPFRYHYTLSQAGYILHPLYLLAGGDIAAFRLLGAALLCLCGAALGLSLARFLSAAPVERVLITITVVIATFWQFAMGPWTPSYNALNLCCLLALFAALFFASAPVAASRSAGGFWKNTIAPAVVAGIAIALAGLSKPTSGLIVAGLGVAWVALLLPGRFWLALAISTITVFLSLLIAAILICGGLREAAERMPVALGLLQMRSGGTEVHVLMNSVLGPFAEDRRWKIVPAIGCSALLFLLSGAGFYAFASRNISHVLRQGIFWSAALVVGLLCAWWRIAEMNSPNSFPGFHAWRFALPMILAALAAGLGHSKIAFDNPATRRILIAGLLSLLAPFAYSFGTNTQLILHISGAAAFWAVAILLLVRLARPPQCQAWMAAAGILCCAATAGMFAGAVAAPVRIATPLWAQTEAISVGPDHAQVLVDKSTAAYVRGLQTMASAAHMRRGTSIIDLSGVGPGIPFALRSAETGTPWLVDGVFGPHAYYEGVLQRVSRKELDHSWLLTAPGTDHRKYAHVLGMLGLAFPVGYVRIGKVHSAAMGWSQELWKPRNPG